MPEKFLEEGMSYEKEDVLPAHLCPVCGKPMEGEGVHSGCEDLHALRNEKLHEEFDNLLFSAERNLETLTREERERLASVGYYYLKIEKNRYLAARVFKALQDFEGLRETAQSLLFEGGSHHDLWQALLLLEDHNGIRDLLNRKDVQDDVSINYNPAFISVREPLYDHVHKFLETNHAPAATGILNDVDLVAIRNLSRHYDIAVPIARGGLNQGAVANLWGMPTRIVDIAAHKRKVPKGKWVNPVKAEDFEGKRVLFFDKDAVSGASMRKAVEMLTPYKPASLGVYFAWDVVPSGSEGAGTHTEGLPEGIKIFSPENAPLENAGDVYMEAHEKLGTLYGRRRLVEHLYIEEVIPKIKERYPELAKAMETFILEHLRMFDSLNPKLPGISEVREKILLKLKQIYREHNDYLRTGMYDYPETSNRFAQGLAAISLLPDDFGQTLIKERYAEQGKSLAEKRKVENLHYPDDPLAAFRAARKAVKNGFDAAIIVGPEGFAYEPYFRDLGLPTLAVNIPESEAGVRRTIKLFDDLSSLRGKKVLVVEDDVRTGATLKKISKALKANAPAHLGLYLGQPKKYQIEANIPSDFKETYVAETDPTPAAATKDFLEYLETRGLNLFKQKIKI